MRADDTKRFLFEFTMRSESQGWTSVNDTVMGGRSEGAFRTTDEGVLEFYGNLSLENRGGFASIRSRSSTFDFSNVDDLVLRVRGDGRAYFLSLYVPTNRIAYSYRAKFDTEAGRWQEIRLPLKSFQATWFGREQANAPAVDTINVRSLGFMLADKKAGPFQTLRSIGLRQREALPPLLDDLRTTWCSWHELPSPTVDTRMNAGLIDDQVPYIGFSNDDFRDPAGNHRGG